MNKTSNNPADKVMLTQKIVFAVNILAMVVLLAFVCFNSSLQSATGNVVSEQWLIVLTIAAIPCILKWHSVQLKKLQGTGNIKKYKSIFYFRLVLLDVVCLLNLGCLYFTNIRNFTFLSIITIFAMFLTLPSRNQLDEVVKQQNDNNN
ncbi:hypothetical protein M2132_001099 [Dysgonomonas sp. PH5-45]|uniref:hypothetical protein n=1 Tax=unclassified Dysgonomonas TaxID=2630389 RepID=UPI002475704E|nr:MULTISPECIES: hypothetical protein [unclassified Dysgonomonas]MDH6354768.1 hypothetical protein [Dysgonomonas sp. PH5-45]MDH6387667.1 hypothetical protein [Dysgonomonas sp. PH5-37]